MKTKTKHLSIRLSREQYRKLMEALEKEHKSKSSLVRIALSNYLDGTDNKKH